MASVLRRIFKGKDGKMPDFIGTEVLPPELVLEIFKQLDPITAVGLTRVSKRWREFLTTNDALWKHYYLSLWHPHYQQHREWERTTLVEYDRPPIGLSWRMSFAMRYTAERRFGIPENRLRYPKGAAASTGLYRYAARLGAKDYRRFGDKISDIALDSLALSGSSQLCVPESAIPADLSVALKKVMKAFHSSEAIMSLVTPMFASISVADIALDGKIAQASVQASETEANSDEKNDIDDDDDDDEKVDVEKTGDDVTDDAMAEAKARRFRELDKLLECREAEFSAKMHSRRRQRQQQQTQTQTQQDPAVATATLNDYLFDIASEAYLTAYFLDPEDDTPMYKLGSMLTTQGMRKGDTPTNFAVADRIFRRAYLAMELIGFPSVDQLTNWGQALYQHSQIMTDDNPALSERLLLEALRKYNQALGFSQVPDTYLHNAIADAADGLSQLSCGYAQIDYYFHIAENNYRRAIEIDPNGSAPLNNLALCFHNHSFTKTGQTAVRYLEEAITTYAMALAIDDVKYIICYNIGDAITQISHLVHDDALAEKLFKESNDFYARSFEAKKDYYFTQNNWGWCVLDYSFRVPGDPGLKIIADAEEHFNKALEMKPDYHVSISNLGNVWLERGCRLNDQTAFDKAQKYFLRALDLKPLFYKAWHYLGFLKMERARRLPPGSQERMALLREARANCYHAMGAKKCYIACMFTIAQIAVLLGDLVECEYWAAKYNSITGAVQGNQKGEIALDVDLFAKNADDLAFSFKTVFWRYCNIKTNYRP